MRTILSLFAATALIAGCQKPAPKAAHVDHAWVRLPAVAGNPGAAYFTLTGGPVAERLMTVSSPLVIRSEMHDMTMKGTMMSMAPIDAGLDVPAGGAVSFAPGGKHVMLFDISPKAVVGTKLPLVLSFASGATLKAEAEVLGAGDEPPHAH